MAPATIFDSYTICQQFFTLIKFVCYMMYILQCSVKEKSDHIEWKLAVINININQLVNIFKNSKFDMGISECILVTRLI